jgi:hypothetical protein
VVFSTACVGHYVFLGGMVLNSLKQADRYRGLAEEFRRLAAFSFSIQMQNHYFQMAEHYSALADAEKGYRLAKLPAGTDPAAMPAPAAAGPAGGAGG